MPELPEVETVVSILKPLLINKKIINVKVFYERMILSDLNEFKSALKNQTFINITRKGKFIIFHLSNNLVLISHLRMEGKYAIKKINDANPLHTHVEFTLNNDEKLLYYDTRKFGIMKLTTEEEFLITKPISELGIEPMDINEINIFQIYKKLNCKKPIKELLLDQSIMCGIGNIYADEICYATHLNPFTPGNTLSRLKYDEIIKQASSILKQAIKNGGSTIKSYHPSEGVDGRFQTLLHAYGKAGTACPICGTIFHKTTLGGRGTTFCPNCQKDESLCKAIAITGPIGSGKSLALNVFKEHGYEIIDCDQIVREIYKNPEVIKNVVKILGSGILEDEKLNTKKMRLLIEQNENLQQRLELYVFPLVEEILINKIKNNDKIVVEIQFLSKSHLNYLFKHVILLEAKNEKLLEYILPRNYKNPQAAIDLYFKNNKINRCESDIIIQNNGSKEEFLEKINNIINKF
ncbi:MAG: DNA-formamidopyrimidine glycosylase [Bacilli bacterium]